MAIINLEMIGQMIADHDCDRRSQDFEKVIMSDCGSQFGKMIVSDRGSQKKWSNPSLGSRFTNQTPTQKPKKIYFFKNYQSFVNPTHH